MHQQEDPSLRTVSPKCIQTVEIVDKILIHLTRLDVKHVDKDSDVLEYRGALRRQIGIHERILTSTIPQIEDEVAQESDMVLLDVDRSTQSRCKGCWVI